MNNRNTKYFNIFYSDLDTNIIDQIIMEVDGRYKSV